jgi:hypothetical protein
MATLGLFSFVTLVGCGPGSQPTNETEAPTTEASEGSTTSQPISTYTMPSSSSTFAIVAGLVDDPRITRSEELPSADSCRIEDVTNESIDTSSGFPRPVSAVTDINTRLLVVPVSTRDLTFGPQDQEYLDKSLEGTRDYFNAMSGSTVTIEWEIMPSVDWPSFDISAQELVGGGQFTTRLPAAQKVVDTISSKYQPSDFDLLAVYFPSDDSILFGEALEVDFGPGRGPVNALIVGGGYVRFWEVMAHEIGHSWLGLEDLYSFEDNSQPMGDWDLMQQSLLVRGKTLTAWNRWLVGWVPHSSVRCVLETGTTVHYLAPLSEGVDQPQMVVVRTGDSSALVVEARRASEYDDVESTTIVYTVDTENRTGFVPIRLNAELVEVGDSATVGNVSVSLLDRSVEGDLVSVTVL